MTLPTATPANPSKLGELGRVGAKRPDDQAEPSGKADQHDEEVTEPEVNQKLNRLSISIARITTPMANSAHAQAFDASTNSATIAMKSGKKMMPADPVLPPRAPLIHPKPREVTRTLSTKNHAETTANADPPRNGPMPPFVPPTLIFGSFMSLVWRVQP